MNGTEPSQALTHQNPPHIILLRTLRRSGVRLYAVSGPLIGKIRTWTFRISNTQNSEAFGTYRTEWDQHKNAIKLRLQSEWGMRHWSNAHPCPQCGAVEDTKAAVLHARGEPITPRDPSMQLCLTCHPEIERELYGGPNATT